MTENTFDRVARRLGAGASRRRMLGVLAGAAAAALAGTAVEAKRGQGRGQGQGQGRGKGQGRGNARGTVKVSFCHTSDEGGYEYITVAEPARKAHEAHGDVECVADPCKVYTGTCSATGECEFEAQAGAKCGEGLVCDAAGACVPTPAENGGEEIV